MIRDHGGGLDAAVAAHGGMRSDWLDLSTGINPVPYPVADIRTDGWPADCWTALPDSHAMNRLLDAARRFWAVPQGARIIAAPGASALIARMPALVPPGTVHIPGPTYNEHAAAFMSGGHQVTTDPRAPVHVLVHPNNPDGRLWSATAIGNRRLTVIDESFCDVAPAKSHVARTAENGVVILKSFGKFWGLAGMRLGFAIGQPDLMDRLADMLGPWPVSGAALHIGAIALGDSDWAQTARHRLAADAARLDTMITARGGRVLGGTTLFRLYEVDRAQAWQDRLVQSRVWSRVFPYAPTWLRLGLPHPDRWDQVGAAL